MRTAHGQIQLGVRFRDGLGTRVTALDDPSGDTVELFYLCPELGAYERSIRERTERLINFKHPRFAAVRGLRVGVTAHGRLAVVGDHIVGPRLSELLLAAARGSIVVDVHATLYLLRELLNAISVLHDSRSVTHGAIAPERLVVTPRGRLVIVEYTIGLALERLQYNRQRLWRDFHIAMPAAAGPARFDRQTDVVQAGHVALAMLTGRLFNGTDQPPGPKALLGGAAEATTRGDRRPLSDGLQSWLERMISADTRKPFTTVAQAVAALDLLIAKEKRLGVAPAALKALVTRFLAASETAAVDGRSHGPGYEQAREPAHEAAREAVHEPANEPAQPPTWKPAPEELVAAAPVVVATPAEETRQDSRTAARPPSAPMADGAFDLGTVTRELMQVEDPIVRAILTMELPAAEAAAERTGTTVEQEALPDIYPSDDRPVDELIAEAGPPVVIEVEELVVRMGEMPADEAEEPEPVRPQPPVEHSIEPAREHVPIECSEPEAANPELPPEPVESGPPQATTATAGAAPLVSSTPDEEPLSLDSFVEILSAGSQAEAQAEAVASDTRPEPTVTAGFETGAVSEAPPPEPAAAAMPAADEGPVRAEAPATEPVAVTDGTLAADEVPAIAAVPATLPASTMEPAPAADETPLQPERPAEAVATIELTPQEEISAARESLRQMMSSIRAKWFGTSVRPDRIDQPATVSGSAGQRPAEPPDGPPPVVVSPGDSSLNAVDHPDVLPESVEEPAEEPIANSPEPAVIADPAVIVGHVADVVRVCDEAPVEAVARALATGEAVEPIEAVDLGEIVEVGEAVGSVEEAAPGATVDFGEAVEFIETADLGAAAELGTSVDLAGVLGIDEAATAIEAAAATTEAVSEALETPVVAGADIVAAPEAHVEAKPPEAAAEESAPAYPGTGAELPPALSVEPLAVEVPPVDRADAGETAGEGEATEAADDLAVPAAVEEPAVDAAVDIDPRSVIEPWPVIDLLPGAGTQSSTELSSATQPHWTAELDRLAEALSMGEPPPTAAMQLAAEPQPVAESGPGDSSAAERIAEEIPRATSAPTIFTADDLPAVASETETPHIAWTDVETEPLADTSAHTSGEGHPSAAVGRGQVLVFTSPTPGAIEDTPVPRRTRPRVRWRRMAAVAATLVLVGAGGVRLATATLFRAPFSEGRASIESVPPGLEVCIDGTVRGVTPLTLSLPAGEHALEVRGRGLARTLPLRVAAGALAYERLTWPASVRTGAVRVESVPPGARVTVDGIPRGVTPVTVLGLSARTHSVVVEGPSGRAEQVVRVEPETTTDVRMAVFSGWLQVAARLDLQILEDGHVIGTSDVERIVMPAGRHTIVLVNERYGFGESREITIEPGGVTRVAVDLPAGGVHVDAPAGSEVYLDGERVGTAPMPPIDVPLGTHNVRVKGPQGEQQRAFVVTLREPVRLAFTPGR